MNSLIFDRNLPHDSFARQRMLATSRVAVMWERMRRWLLEDFMPDFEYDEACGSGC